jgi:hypothetical protein
MYYDLPKISLSRVDRGLIWGILLTPPDSGTPLIQEFVLRTFGTANWTQFCPGMIIGNPPRRAG